MISSPSPPSRISGGTSYNDMLYVVLFGILGIRVAKAHHGFVGNTGQYPLLSHSPKSMSFKFFTHYLCNIILFRWLQRRTLYQEKAPWLWHAICISKTRPGISLSVRDIKLCEYRNASASIYPAPSSFQGRGDVTIDSRTKAGNLVGGVLGSLPLGHRILCTDNTLQRFAYTTLQSASSLANHICPVAHLSAASRADTISHAHDDRGLRARLMQIQTEVPDALSLRCFAKKLYGESGLCLDSASPAYSQCQGRLSPLREGG